VKIRYNVPVCSRNRSRALAPNAAKCWRVAYIIVIWLRFHHFKTPITLTSMRKWSYIQWYSCRWHNYLYDDIEHFYISRLELHVQTFEILSNSKSPPRRTENSKPADHPNGPKIHAQCQPDTRKTDWNMSSHTETIRTVWLQITFCQPKNKCWRSWRDLGNPYYFIIITVYNLMLCFRVHNCNVIVIFYFFILCHKCSDSEIHVKTTER